MEEALFGAPGTPERNEYEARVALELLPQTIRDYRLRNHLTQVELGERIGVQKAQSASWSATLPTSPLTRCAAFSRP